MKSAFIFILISFYLPFVVLASVVINEVAWMGTKTHYSNEWIELYNAGSESVDLNSWILSIEGKKEIILEGSLAVNSYYLIERTDDDSVSGIAADLISAFGRGGLSNSGEILILKNASGAEVDRLDASGGWPAGDNSTKETMQRSASSWITAGGTPKEQNAGVSIEQTNEKEAPPQAPKMTGGVTFFVQTENLITVNAGEDKTVIAGAAARFEGRAFGFKNEPLKTADFLWSFGDGSFKRGRSILHTYYYPGTYNADLNVSTGEVAALDRMIVTVVPNSVMISEVKPGITGWIELHNNSQFDIDLSGWKISSGSIVYMFPQSTKILADAYIVIPYEVSHIAFLLSGSAFLKYPNNVEAHEFQYSGFIKNDESFHNIQGSVQIGLESPGNERFTVRMAKPLQSLAPVSQKPSSRQKIPVAEEKAILSPDEIEETGKENLALVHEAIEGRSNFFSGSIFWFGIALGIGVLSAAGYLFIKRKGFF